MNPEQAFTEPADTASPAMDAEGAPQSRSWVIDGKKTALLCFWALFAHVLLQTILLHFTITQLSGAQEYREGAILDTTHLLINGQHPYSAENLPSHTNVYGVTLSAIMAALSPWLEPDLTNHRVVSGLFILLACGILGSIALRSGLNRIEALFTGAFFYILINLSYSVLARPDGVALFIMFSCIRLAMIRPGKPWTIPCLGLSVVLACMAFFTKPYFFFGAGCAAVYLGYHRSMRAAVFYWLSVCILLGICLAVASQVWPLYWFSTFQIHRLANTPHTDHYISQWKFFGYTHLFWSVAFLCAIPGLFRLKRRLNRGALRSVWTSGLDTVAPGHWAGFCSCAAILILACSLAWHQGAYLIYFIHLLTPFLLISGFRAVSRLSVTVRESMDRVPGTALLAILQLVILLTVIRPVPSMEIGPYVAWKYQLNPGERILATPLLVPEMLERGVPYPDNGQTEYFLACSLGFPESTDPEVLALSQQFLLELRTRVDQGWYDKIIMVPQLFSHYFAPGQIEKNYQLKAEGYHYAYYSNFVEPWEYGNGQYPLQLWVRKSPEESDVESDENPSLTSAD
jgi:hypothetical protein